MAHSPIVVKETTRVVKNPRQELLEEEVDQIIGGKGMIIKGYKTEKMRIEEHLKNINYYFPNDEKFNTKENFENLINNKNINNKLFLKQPEMRYKPRTDLERVFDAIQKNSVRKMDKNIIHNQFKNLDLKLSKKNNNFGLEEILDYRSSITKPTEISEGEFNYLGINETAEKIKAENERKIITNKKELNSEAKNLIKEFHSKTHFKGVACLGLVNLKPETCKKFYFKI